MLNFNHSTDEPQARLRRRARAASRRSWRVWTLLLALGLVVLAMRQLDQPETVDRLGQLFGAPEAASDATGEAVEIESTPQARPTLPPKPIALRNAQATSNNSSAEDSDALAKIRDNTYFRPAESEAWFGLLGDLQSKRESELSDATLGELTYAQLLKQPDYYRGKVVTVRGTVRREELEQAPKNELNIENYHRLWIEPQGGGNWPIVVYSLSVPEDFPRGDKIKAAVSITGYYFKNWSYPWSDGLGIAPVVLARGVEWQPPTISSFQSTPTDGSWVQAAFVACVFAALVVYFVLRNTRRPVREILDDGVVQLPTSDTPTESVREQLVRLAETEPKQ